MWNRRSVQIARPARQSSLHRRQSANVTFDVATIAGLVHLAVSLNPEGPGQHEMAGGHHRRRPSRSLPLGWGAPGSVDRKLDDVRLTTR